MWFIRQRDGIKRGEYEKAGTRGRHGGLEQAELRRPEGPEIKQALRVLDTPCPSAWTLFPVEVGHSSKPARINSTNHVWFFKAN